MWLKEDQREMRWRAWEGQRMVKISEEHLKGREGQCL